MSKGNLKLFTLPLLLVLCTSFYYFGELVDWAVWEALRRDFFYGIHDIHRLLFLAPIIYAGYTGRIKGAVIVTLLSLAIFLPRAFFISPFPDPLLRTVLFTAGAGSIGVLTGIIRNKAEQCILLETEIKELRDKALSIVNGIGDGILITGPDYAIRYMNSKMARDFGKGTSLTCYKLLRNRETPCEHNCGIKDIINGSREIARWECALPGGKIFQVVAVPYVDLDGTACQISVFRNISTK
ncbi:MAG: hypothetical protein JRJ77_17565 [Deltaproteobacteria bacterium]|nr:hypothetical protein [Deltaproteobacteria bacterium]